MRLGPRGDKRLKAFAQVGAVGLELGISTVVGLLLGRWVDGKLDSEPACTIIGLLLGVLAGFRSLIRAARRATADLTKDDANDDG